MRCFRCDVPHAIWLMRLAHSRHELKFAADPDRLLTAEKRALFLLPGACGSLFNFTSSLLWWPDVFIASRQRVKPAKREEKRLNRG